jgi:hypothetical protein
VRWHTAHFDYAARLDDTATCSDVTSVLENHWAFWHSRLSLAAEAAPPIQYFKFRDTDDLRGSGGCAYGGCTDGTRVKTSKAFDPHELIHAYLGAHSAPPPPLFAEGAAVAFSCDWDGLPVPAMVPGWRDLLAPVARSPQFYSLYPLAGQLVRHLVSQYGIDKFMGFYRSVAGDLTADVVAARFTAAFGVALDDVWSQAAGPDRPICLYWWECNQPGIVLDGTATSSALTCGLDLVPRTLKLPDDTNLSGWLRGAPSNPTIAASCGDSPTTGVLTLWPGGSFHLQTLLARGTYVTRLGGAEVSLTASPPSIGSSCANVMPRALTAAELPLLIAAPGKGVQYARFSFDKQPTVVAISPASRSTTVRMCGSCSADPSTCPAVTTASESRSTFDGESIWTMQTDSDWIIVRIASP